MTLGSRLEILSLMMKCAYSLSGLVEIKNSSPNIQEKIENSNNVNNNSNNINNTNNNETKDNNSKTIIKRPQMLMKLKQKTKYFRNNFILCAERYFTTVLNLFQTSLNDLLSRIETLNLNSIENGNNNNLIQNNSNNNNSNKNMGNKDFNEIDPGPEILFPAQCLLALGVFTRCSINTILQKNFAEVLLQLSFNLKDIIFLHIRRAAIIAMYDSIESLFHNYNSFNKSRTEVGSTQYDQIFGTLNYAMNILSVEKQVENSLPPLIIEVINWVSNRINNESDQDCRVFECEILRLGISFLDNFQRN